MPNTLSHLQNGGRSFSSDIRLTHQCALAPEETSYGLVRNLARSLRNVEVHHAIRSLMIGAVDRLQHQAVTPRRQVLYVHHQAARDHRIPLLNKVIRRREPAKEHVLVTRAFIDVIYEP